MSNEQSEDPVLRLQRFCKLVACQNRNNKWNPRSPPGSSRASIHLGTSLWLSSQAAPICLKESRSSTISPLGTIYGASCRDSGFHLNRNEALDSFIGHVRRKSPTKEHMMAPPTLSFLPLTFPFLNNLHYSNDHKTQLFFLFFFKETILI